MYYVYRFKDVEGNIIYIGRTENINGRLLNQHFTVRGHLSQECYTETDKVEYAVLSSRSEMRVYELYLINKHAPKYNVLENNQDKFKFTLPGVEWVHFTGENEPSYQEEVGKLERKVEGLQKELGKLKEERSNIREEAKYMLVTSKRYLQTIDYILSRGGVDYDKEDLVRLGLDIEYMGEKIMNGTTEKRQDYYKRRGLGKEENEKILWVEPQEIKGEEAYRLLQDMKIPGERRLP